MGWVGLEIEGEVATVLISRSSRGNVKSAPMCRGAARIIVLEHYRALTS